jgi:hypothetical protein
MTRNNSICWRIKNNTFPIFLEQTVVAFFQSVGFGDVIDSPVRRPELYAATSDSDPCPFTTFSIPVTAITYNKDAVRSLNKHRRLPSDR